MYLKLLITAYLAVNLNLFSQVNDLQYLKTENSSNNLYYASKYENLENFISGLGTTTATLIVDTKTIVNSDLIFPPNINISFINDGGFIIRNNYAITIESSINASINRQIFFGSGKVNLKSLKNTELYPEWWGAKADSTVNSTKAINSFLLALSSSNNSHFTGKFLPGIYVIDTLLIKSKYGMNSILLEGTGLSATKLLSVTNGNTITIIGKNVELRNLIVDASKSKIKGNGIYINSGRSSQGRIHLENIVVQNHPGNGIEAVKPELHYYQNVWAQFNGGKGFFLHREKSNHGGIQNTLLNCRSIKNGENGFVIEDINNNTLINLESLQNLKSSGDSEMLISGRNNILINPDVERADGQKIGIELQGKYHQIMGGYINRTKYGIYLNNVIGCKISFPYFHARSSNPMTEAVHSINSKNCIIEIADEYPNIETVNTYMPN